MGVGVDPALGGWNIVRPNGSIVAWFAYREDAIRFADPAVIGVGTYIIQPARRGPA